MEQKTRPTRSERRNKKHQFNDLKELLERLLSSISPSCMSALSVKGSLPTKKSRERKSAVGGRFSPVALKVDRADQFAICSSIRRPIQ